MEPKYKVDEFDVIQWTGLREGGCYHIFGNDPFEELLEPLKAAPPGWEHAALTVRDSLVVARTIAVSIFGKHVAGPRPDRFVVEVRRGHGIDQP